MSQRDEILAYLERGNSLTPLEALNLFGCLRLGARIYDLKKEGYKIRSEDLQVNGKRVAKYSLIPEGALF